MTTTPTSRAVTAVLTGLTTTAYYAVPDVARTRAARGWLKAACLVAGAAVAMPTSREGWQELRPTWKDEPDATSSDDAAGDATDGGSRAGRAAVIGVGVALLAAGTAGTVAFERWIYRRGEALAAAGVPFAHTRAALVLGVGSTLLALLPEPADDRDGRRD